MWALSKGIFSFSAASVRSGFFFDEFLAEIEVYQVTANMFI